MNADERRPGPVKDFFNHGRPDPIYFVRRLAKIIHPIGWLSGIRKDFRSTSDDDQWQVVIAVDRWMGRGSHPARSATDRLRGRRVSGRFARMASVLCLKAEE
jgi:hypothetical protein